MKQQRSNLKAQFTVLTLQAGLVQEAMGSNNVCPTPPWIDSDSPATYCGPLPSSVGPELIDPHQLLTVDMLNKGTATIALSLYRGDLKETGKAIWYAVPDLPDANDTMPATLWEATYACGLRNVAIDRHDSLLIMVAGEVLL